MKRMSWIERIAIILSFVALIVSVRGLPGNPTPQQLSTTAWKEDGPFELSPERGRYALTYALAEARSVYLPVSIAKFVLPDLGYNNGHYVSLFAPALSFIVMPGYVIGKALHASQFGTFLVIGLFAFANLLLIRKIAIGLSADPAAATLAGMAFLFGTPAFSYAVNLYQHHVTSFLLLSAIALALFSDSLLSLFGVFFLFAVGVPLDYPNFFIFMPVLLFATSKILSVKTVRSSTVISVTPYKFAGALGIVLPLLFFLWFNTVSYGGPLHMLGTSAVTVVHDIDANGQPVSKAKKPEESVTVIQGKLDEYQRDEKKGGLSYFDSRNLVNGLYILFVSPDRGILYFAPLFAIGALGLALLKKRFPSQALVLASVIAFTVLLYSMWGDPWGGWAFGARYLIPAYAVAAIPLAYLLSEIRKKWPLVVIILFITAFSVYVNTAGALSSSANPPKVQVLELEQLSGRQERYSFDRNLHSLANNQSKSFVYQTAIHSVMDAQHYLYLVSGSIVCGILLLAWTVVRRKGNA